MAEMPESLQELCGLLKQGESQSAIARELSVPRTTLQEYVRRIRRRFEDAGLRDYL
jgi:DNA-binding NarL/FixJ family response regulator